MSALASVEETPSGDSTPTPDPICGTLHLLPGLRRVRKCGLDEGCPAKCAAVEVPATCQQSKAPHLGQRGQSLGKQYVQWDHEEVPSVWRRPKPRRATYLAARIVVGRLFGINCPGSLCMQCPTKPRWFSSRARKRTLGANMIGNASAPPQQAPSNGCQASTNVGIVQVKRKGLL